MASKCSHDRRGDLRFAPAFLMLSSMLGCALPTSSASGPAGSSADPAPGCFCADSVAPCLDEAEAMLRLETATLDAMRRTLGTSVMPAIEPATPGDADSRSARLGVHGLPIDLLSRFDGHWRGHWGDMPVEHVWLSIDRATQLVVIDDDGVRKHGINLVGEDGTICGLVLEGDRARLHQGRYREAFDAIEWTTPDRTYRESVTGSPGNRRYHIVEQVLTGGADDPLETVYREVSPATGPPLGQCPLTHAS